MAGPTLTDGAVIVQTQDQILSELNTAFRAAFGPDFELSDDSFTYRQNAIWATREAILQSLLASALAANDIERATGRQLDYAGSLLNAPRKAATRSTITATLYGTPGTNVGDKRVRYVLTGDLWRVPVGTVIGANGSVSVSLTSETAGPVFAAAQASTAWVIVDVTTGWQRLESTADAQRGRTREIDPEYRARLLAALSTEGGTEPAARAKIAATKGVTAYSYDNNRSPVKNANGVPAWHAESVVTGGTDLDVATTLYNVYGGTTGYYGNTSVVVTDPTDGTTTEVKFSRIVNYQVEGTFKIHLSGDTPLPTGAETTIINAIANRINTNGPGIDVDPGDLIAAAAMALPPGVMEPDNSVGAVAFKGGVPQLAPLVLTHRDNAYTITVPQAAVVTGTVAGPFNLTAGDILDLSVGDVLFTYTVDVNDFEVISKATITELITAIEANAPDNLLVGSSNGALVLTSVDTGEDATIVIGATSSADLLTALGLTTGTTHGTGPDITVEFVGP